MWSEGEKLVTNYNLLFVYNYKLWFSMTKINQGLKYSEVEAGDRVLRGRVSEEKNF